MTSTKQQTRWSQLQIDIPLHITALCMLVRELCPKTPLGQEVQEIKLAQLKALQTHLELWLPAFATKADKLLAQREAKAERERLARANIASSKDATELEPGTAESNVNVHASPEVQQAQLKRELAKTAARKKPTHHAGGRGDKPRPLRKQPTIKATARKKKSTRKKR